MRRHWRRIAIGVMVAAVLVFAATAYWLFYDNRLPRDGRSPLDLAAIPTMCGWSGSGRAT